MKPVLSTINTWIKKEKEYFSRAPGISPKEVSASSRIIRREMPLVLVCIGLLVLLPGVNRPLESHEAYIPLAASTMLESGNFVVPYFNGEPRLKKPPLAYWLAAAVHKLVGENARKSITELQARIPSILTAIALLFVTVGMGRETFGDKRSGWVAAVMLATSHGFFEYGNNARPEMLYTFFCALEMLGFLRLQRNDKTRYDLIAGSLMIWVGFSGAVLSKGPIAPIFFIAALGLSLLAFRSRPPWRISVQLIIGLVTIILVGIYFLYLSKLMNEANQIWAKEIVQSSSTPFWLRVFENGFYFPRVTIRFAKPWFVVLPLIVFAFRQHKKAETWILGFAILILLLLFSFSGKTREHYVLPILPLLFVLMGRGCVYIWDLSLGNPVWRKRISLVLVGHALFFTIGVIALGVQGFQTDPVKGINPLYHVLPFLVVAFVLLILTWRNRYRKMKQAFLSLVVSAAFLYAANGAGALDWKSEYYTKAEFGKAIAHRIDKDQLVVSQTDHQLPTILYYSGRIMPRFHFSELNALLRNNPRALIVTEPRQITKKGLKGEIVVKERMSKKRENALVLFKPAPS